jgi:hypothetical protein
MDRPRIRPTFSVRLAPDADTAMAEIRERLEVGEYEGCFRSKGRCADLFVREEDRRLWSPYLSVQVEPRGEGSLLRGRFGPHPELWTLYMFAYAAVGFLTVMGLMLGFVQWQSGMDPWGFRGALAGGPGLALLYVVSATGQRLGAHQMEELKGRIDSLVAELAYDDTELEPGFGQPDGRPSRSPGGGDQSFRT